MDQKCTNGTRFSTKLGWERGRKSCIANSKDWRSENVNAIELNCKVVKKLQSPPSFLAKNFASPNQVTQFLEHPPLPLLPHLIRMEKTIFVFFLSFSFFQKIAGLCANAWATDTHMSLVSCIHYTILYYVFFSSHNTNFYVYKKRLIFLTM